MKLSHHILLAFTIVILISCLNSYINFRLSQEVKQNTDFLASSEAVVRNSTRLHKTIIEMQSGFRGFLLTDDTAFLDGYYMGITEIAPIFSEQKDLIKGSYSQMELLDSIYTMHKRWVNYSNSLIEAKRSLLASGSAADYSDLFESKLKKQVGKLINDEIAVMFREFDRYEYKIRAERREILISSIDRTHAYSFAFILFTILVGACSTIYIVNLISKRISKMVLLAENISKGEFSIVKDNKNDELTGLSSSLNIMSEKLNKNISELNQFAYVVSHDLKAPIRGIYNVIQWIEEDLGNELSPQMKEYLSFIPQRTKRMEDLINGLLDYARIWKKTKIEQIDTNLMVIGIADAIVPRNIRLDTHNLPKLYSERLKLEQVFTNLISNSVKYMGNQNGHIIISCKEIHHFYEFSVKDNGIGIAPEYHEKIFEIFQTLREKDEKESTGIGLSIVKKIIDDQHCTIKVNSEPGKGAEFIFTWRNK